MFLLLSEHGYACIGLVLNEELSSQLVIEKYSEKNKYKISGPTHISGSKNEAKIYLVYTSTNERDLDINDEMIELKTIIDGGVSYAEFYVALMKSKPYILVEWEGETQGSCSGVAITNFIEVE